MSGTKGLFEEFGPRRIREAPISESAMVGDAVGDGVADTVEDGVEGSVGDGAKDDGGGVGVAALADTRLERASARRADPISLAPLEGALVHAGECHYVADAHRHDGEDGDVRVDLHLVPLVSRGRRRACGCAWKYNSRRRRSVTCV